MPDHIYPPPPYAVDFEHLNQTHSVGGSRRPASKILAINDACVTGGSLVAIPGVMPSDDPKPHPKPITAAGHQTDEFAGLSEKERDRAVLARVRGSAAGAPQVPPQVQAPLIGGAPDDVVVLGTYDNRTQTKQHYLVDGRLATSTPGNVQYYRARVASKVGRLMEFARFLCRIKDNEIIVRGAVLPSANPRQMRRLGDVQADGTPATIAPVVRQWLPFDLDGVDDPTGSDLWRDDPETVIEMAIEQNLPPNFWNISCVWQFTANQGMKPGLRLRLYYMLSRPLGRDDLENWFAPYPHLDMSIVRTVQPIYVGPPRFAAGLVDPVPQRMGFITGYQHIVEVPDAATFRGAIATAALNFKKAKKAATKASRAQRASVVAERRAVDDAGTGFDHYLELIGDSEGQLGCWNPMLSAVGAWWWHHGPNPDLSDALRDHLLEAIAKADWSRHTAGDIKDRVSKMNSLIEDIRLKEEASRAARVPPPMPLPSKTADEVVAIVGAAVEQFCAKVSGWVATRRQAWERSILSGGIIRYGDGPMTWRHRGAVIVSTGVGKSEVVIQAIAAMLATNSSMRIAYVVPEHKLGRDVAERFNKLTGSSVAHVWRGIAQPDPDAPDHRMCRRHEEADIVRKAGYRLSDLCGTEYQPDGAACPFRSDCAYIPQRKVVPQVWIVASAMLTEDLPLPFRRPMEKFTTTEGKEVSARPPAFDLVVIDEAPWQSFTVGDEERPIPLDWFDPLQWTIQDRGDDDAASAATARLRAVLSPVQTAFVDWFKVLAASSNAAVPLTGLPASSELRVAAALMGDCVPDAGRGVVVPDAHLAALQAGLGQRLEITVRVRLLEQVLQALAELVDGNGTNAAFEDVLEGGVKHVRVHWKKAITEPWLDAPIMYLDATARIEVAEQWLGKIEPLCVETAFAPHMRVVQVVGHTFSYAALIDRDADPDAKRSTARANRGRLGHVARVVAAAIGGGGVLIGPKAMTAQMDAGSLIPTDWDVASFGSLRGVDAYRDVPVAMVVSRTLPEPRRVERKAAVAFGRDVVKLGAGEWYPEWQGARLLADGTGLPDEFNRHPDPAVEAFRAMVCDDEVRQAIGRVRGVRRTAENPVLVLVLSDVDLGEIAIDEVITWTELQMRCGPVAQMVAQGIVPKMRTDIIAACGDRWAGSKNPEHALTQWLKDNPGAKDELDAIWATGEARLPWRDTPIRLREEVVGKQGRLPRKAMLAPGVTIAMARALLGP